MKNSRGEISILMIVTVIVLIILGGVTIAMLTGDSGLFVRNKNQQNDNGINTNQTQNITNDIQEQNQNTTNTVQDQEPNTNGELVVPVQ